MYFKAQLITILILTLFSCKQVPTSSDIIITLTQKTGKSPFGYGSMPTYLVSDSSIIQKFKGVPDSCQYSTIRKFRFQPYQDLYERYLDGKVEKERFFELIKIYDIDTMTLSTEKTQNAVYCLVGITPYTKIAIFDKNRNYDFSDDEVLVYYLKNKDLSKDSIRRLTTPVTISTEYYHYKKYQKEITFRPIPFGKYFTSYPNEEAEMLEYFYEGFEYEETTIEVNKKPYKVVLDNLSPELSYDSLDTKLLIEPLDSISDKLDLVNNTYRLGDYIYFDSIQYRFDYLSLFGDTVILKKQKKVNKKIGYTAGLYLPNIESNDLIGNTITTEDLKGDYILLDFWGTWCQPCIKMIPSIREIQNEYRDDGLKVVSVAFDRDKDKVEQFIRDYEMNWIHLYEDRNDRELNGFVKKLRAEHFPTTILISPDGRIIGRWIGGGKNTEEKIRLQLNSIFNR